MDHRRRLTKLRHAGSLLPRLPARAMTKARVSSVADVPVEEADTRRVAYDPIKRLMDILVAAMLLVGTAPLHALVALLVRLKLGSPVYFHQVRPGRDEATFELVKFRTMVHPDPSLRVITDEQRMTPLGALLRSTSLDELPTLWNVLRGDMSLVGPRPLLVRYLDRYTPEQRRRHQVRPGVTGLAQVSGRNALAWEERFAKDLEYVERRSLGLDLRILARTAVQVLRRQGISDELGPTMTEFMGKPGQPSSDRHPS
jgi:lipopolysaccharide/colanic/teichoic acid biosynthesis glycosyltransferase